MRKFFFSIVLGIFSLFFSTQQAFAIDNNELPDIYECSITINGARAVIANRDPRMVFARTRVDNLATYDAVVSLSPAALDKYQGFLNEELDLAFQVSGGAGNQWSSFTLSGGNQLSTTISVSKDLDINFVRGIDIETKTSREPICQRMFIKVNGAELENCVTLANNAGAGTNFNSVIAQGTPTTFTFPSLASISNSCGRDLFGYKITRDGSFVSEGFLTSTNNSVTLTPSGIGQYRLDLTLSAGGTSNNPLRTVATFTHRFCVHRAGGDACTVYRPIGPEGNTIETFSLCGQLPEGSVARSKCDICVQADEQGNPKGIYSALGCIPVDEQGFLRQMIQLLLSVSGLIALLSILAGAFMLSTSQGDSNQVKKAKELITAAVSGLLFIIFSTIILDFIGVQILRIPGLS